MIEINKLEYRYPNAEKNALNAISFDLQLASTIGLLGPNGAGKTTLMSLLAGLQSVQQGEIYFDGVPLAKLSKKQRHQISLVPQDFAFYPLLTVWENLTFFCIIV